MCKFGHLDYLIIHIYTLSLDAEYYLLIDTGIENCIDSVDDSVVGDIECSDLADVTIQRSFGGSQDNGSPQSLKFPSEKVILLFL